MSHPTALTIAGSDSGGGAGIQADLKAFAAVGVHGASALTCITSQNTEGVSRVDPLPVEGVLAQVDTVLADLDVRAVKTGMLHTPQVVEAVADRLQGEDLPLVVDPVMVATSGDSLSASGLEEALARLASVATLVTPNADELSVLTGRTVGTEAEAEAAARDLLEAGWPAVLAKGGHLDGHQAVDLLVTSDGIERLPYPRARGPFHGAGCTYASLVGGLLARGHGLGQAVTEARARMHRAIQRAYPVGAGPRVLDALERAEPGAGPEGAAASVLAWRIAAELPLVLVPEVGTNLAYAPEGADRPDQVLGLAQRITRTRRGPSAPGPAVPGGSGHVARVLLAARQVDPDTGLALNLAYREAHVAAAREAGLPVARFDRAEEPPQADSSMEWGTLTALKAHGGPAALVVDDGGKGKEAMMRLLARSPEELVARLRALVDALGAGPPE